MNASIGFLLVILAVTSCVISRPQCDCQRPIFGRSYVASLSGESSGNRLPCEHQAPSFFRARAYAQPQPIQQYVAQPTYRLRPVSAPVPAHYVYRTVPARAPPRGRSYLVKEITPQHSEPAAQPVQTVPVSVEAAEPAPAPVQTILEPAPAPAPVQTIIAEPAPAPAPVETVVAAPAPVATPTRIQTIYTAPAPAPVRMVLQRVPAPPSMQTVVVKPRPVAVKIVRVPAPRIVMSPQRSDNDADDCPVHRSPGSDSDDSESLECTCVKK